MISKAIHYKMIKASTLLWLAVLNAFTVWQLIYSFEDGDIRVSEKHVESC